VEIIHSDITQEEACELEKHLIFLYGRKDLGLGNLVNMTDGGEGSVGFICSDKTKQKMSKKRKGDKHYNFGKPLSENIKQKISETKKGKPSNRKGFIFSEETKQKIANTQRAILTNGSDESEVRKYNYISKRNNADPEPVPPQVSPYIPDNSFLQDGDLWFEEK
jgi:hypothetical protein